MFLNSFSNSVPPPGPILTVSVSWWGGTNRQGWEHPAGRRLAQHAAAAPGNAAAFTGGGAEGRRAAVEMACVFLRVPVFGG